MVASRVVCGLVLGAVGCGTRSTRPTAADRALTSVDAGGDSGRRAVLDDRRDAAAEPADLPTGSVEIPTGLPACLWPRPAWYGSLSVTRDGAPFAMVLEEDADLLAPAIAGGMVARLARSHLHVTAWVHQPSLYLARATPLVEVVYPRSDARLGWRGLGRTGGLEVSLDVSATLAAPTEVTAELPCDRLSPTAVHFAPPVAPRAAAPRLITSVPAPLSAKPRGAVVATLRADIAVATGRRRGSYTQVFADGIDHLVTGWIPSLMLSSGVVGSGYGIHGEPGRYGAKVTVPAPHRGSCARAVPIFVEHAGARTEIGELAAGAVLPERIGDADRNGVVAIEPYGRQWLKLEDGARLVARVVDLDACVRP
ncbi:MAG: hypothetical protein IPL61_00295 [Myxococcales bacterium]|nr:hypothetical protein [Myxococcales bacterium]